MDHSKTIQIGERLVGVGRPAYIIAEIGSNHDQDKHRALDLIALAAEAGADAAKFQSLRFDRMYRPQYESQEFRAWFAKIELPEDWYPDLAEAARRHKIHFMSSVCYPEAVHLLEAVGVPAYKLGSPQTQGDPWVQRKVAETGKPVIMSTGYCRYDDIAAAVETCHQTGNRNLVLLHCISKYPSAPHESNLGFMQTLRDMTGHLTGFSDHSSGSHLAVAAVALGAVAIEKHITADRDGDGPDHHFALTVKEFAETVRQIRELESALGDGTRFNLLPEEAELRRRYTYMAFAARDIAAGERFMAENIAHFRSESVSDAVAAADPLLLRAHARRAVKRDEPITWDNILLPPTDNAR
jgi:sialic acid synthase SpsE